MIHLKLRIYEKSKNEVHVKDGRTTVFKMEKYGRAWRADLDGVVHTARYWNLLFPAIRKTLANRYLDPTQIEVTIAPNPKLKMRTETIKTTEYETAKNQTPWATIWAQVPNGFLAFESQIDFNQWKRAGGMK